MTNDKPGALPVVAEPCIECWSCHVPVTLNERAECDGECPHCASELDLDDYLGTAVLALAELRNERDTLQAELAAMRVKLANYGRGLSESDAVLEYNEKEADAQLRYEPLQWIKNLREGCRYQRAKNARLMAADPVVLVAPDSWLKFIQECSGTAGTMVNGNQLSITASQLLYDQPTPISAPSQVAAEVVHTDCRSDEGITVGLIDTIINSARLLKGRAVTPAVMSAVEDLLQDKDLRALLATSQEKAE